VTDYNRNIYITSVSKVEQEVELQIFQKKEEENQYSEIKTI